MKKIAFGLLCLPLMFSCQKEASQESTKKSSPILPEQAVSVIDTRIRSLDTQTYVKELYVVDFSGTGLLSAKLAYYEQQFIDDGSGYDLVAGDNIYTKTELGYFDEAHPYNAEHSLFSVQGKALINPSFQYTSQLNSLLTNYIPFGYLGFALECDVDFGTSGCRAEQWGWCTDCCFSLSNCTVSVGISW